MTKQISFHKAPAGDQAAQTALLLRQLRALREDLEMQVQTARQQETALKDCLLRATEREGALQQRLDMCEAEVRQLRASTSWRLTAPLRALKRLFAGPRDRKA